MDNIQIIGGIKVEPSAIKTELPICNNANIVEISAEDIMRIRTEDNEEQEELQTNTNDSIVEIDIEDIRDVEKHKQEREKRGTIQAKPIKEEPIVEITAEDIKDTNEEEKVKDSQENSDNNNNNNNDNRVDIVAKNKQKKVSASSIVNEKLILNDAYEDLFDKTSKNKNPKATPVVKRNCKINASSETVLTKEFVLSKDKKYHCKHCKAVLTSKRGITAHIRHYHRDDSIYDGTENKLMNNLDNKKYVAWYEYKLKEKDIFICNHCQEVVQGDSQMRLHITHKHKTGEKRVKCPHCPYTSPYDLRHHILFNHTEDKDMNYFRCDQCKNSKFKSKRILRTHIRQVHTRPEDLYGIKETCPKCSKTFTDMHRFRRHMLETHQAQNFKCLNCNFKCRRKENLIAHNETRHSNTDELETLHCYHCPFKTKHKTKLRRHFQEKHMHRFQCHMCSYQCTIRTHLQLHLISHKDKKDDKDLRYRCESCDYRTYRIYSLKVHQLNHLKPSEIQYFHCYHCDFKAKRKDNLKTHIFRTHKRKEVVYRCFVCDFTTTNQHRLVCHVNKHKDEQKQVETRTKTRRKPVKRQ